MAGTGTEGRGSRNENEMSPRQSYALISGKTHHSQKN